MLKFLLGMACSGLMMAGTAAAADVTTVPTPAFDWSGPYAGVQGGFATGLVNQRIPTYGPNIPVGNLSGALVGGYAGWRKQLNTVVLGAELGANWRFVDGNNSSGNGATEMLDTKQNWDASLVAKVGVPMNQVLIYALGGADVSSFNAKYSTGGSRSADATAWGWVAGAGIEAALSQKVTARIEYRYTSYGEVSVKCPTCGPTFVTPQEHSVAVGLSYKF